MTGFSVTTCDMLADLSGGRVTGDGVTDSFPGKWSGGLHIGPPPEWHIAFENSETTAERAGNRVSTSLDDPIVRFSVELGSGSCYVGASG
jgi:hypothetical protein